MTDTGPAFRANWTRIMLEYYERNLPVKGQSALEAALDPATRARLMAAGPLEWLPAETHMKILPAPYAVMGETAYRAFWKAMMIDSFDRPIFRSFVRGAVTAFGDLRGQIFRMVPAGFALIARGSGEFKIEISGKDHRANVLWESIPLLLRRGGAFPMAWAGSLEAILAITKTEGRVEVAPFASHASRVQYEVRWRE
jgi:hypothetical protein